MNSLGRLFRIHILGESHGEYVGVVIDGCPAGLPISANDFKDDMDRRKGGSKGTTPRTEDDIPLFASGLFNGWTTGSPLTILFENKNTRPADYEKNRNVPRPGHADWIATKKFGGFEDYRGGGHFSGRLTVCLVAAGLVAKKIIAHSFSEAKKAIEIKSTIIEVGGETDIDKGLQKAIDAKDSVGGIIECFITGMPAGLGEPFFDSVESLISHGVFAIPAIRGIEFGTGFAAAKMFGSKHNDPIINSDGITATNHAGGVTGGLSNGNDIVFRVAVKPTSSTPKEQQTLNTDTNEMEAFSVKGRHDLCIALRVPVVLEAVAAIVLTDLLMLENNTTNHFIIKNNTMQTPVIYHFTTLDEWEHAQDKGFYESKNFAEDGFIHCANEDQLDGVLERYFARHENLVKLVIDPLRLTHKIKYEMSEKQQQEFPHIHGQLNLEAVTQIIFLDPISSES